MLLMHARAASTTRSAPGVITGEDMKRVRAADAWLNGGPPPPVWEVKTKEDVSVGKELARGRSKCVKHGRLGRGKVVIVAVCPVSNSSNCAEIKFRPPRAIDAMLSP